MPVVPLIVGIGVGTGTAAAIGTAIAGAAVSTAVATGIGAAVIGTGAALATGQDVGDALKTGVTSGLTAGVGSSIGSALEGASAAGTGLTAGAGGATGLTSGAAGVTGLTAPTGFTFAPNIGAGVVTAGSNYGLLDGDYTSSIGETGLLPGATEGFQASAIPSAPGMGGAQGLTVPVAGGTVTASGLIPTGATIPLGGGKELGLLDAARGLNNLRNLTFKPPQPGQQQQPMRRPQSQFSLPAAQPTVVGLLPLAERYRRSLL